MPYSFWRETVRQLKERDFSSFAGRNGSAEDSYLRKHWK